MAGTAPFGGRTLRRVEFDVNNEQAGEYNGDNVGEVVTDITEATVVSSDWGVGKYHLPVIDIDTDEVRLVPSSTPGHCHLYINVPFRWEQYLALLDILVDVGLVQPGYVAAAKRRGHTDVRLPWVKKNPGPAPTGVPF